jgi:hypothetical protein
MRFDDLAVVVAQQVGAIAVQHAGPAGGQRGRVAPGLDALARRFSAEMAHLAIVEEGMEEADGIAAATHARGQRIRQAAVLSSSICAAPRARPRR